MTPNNMSDQLALPLRWADVNCPCCGLSALDVRLLDALSLLDVLLPSRYCVTSLCRCARHNADVGGVPASLHLIGRAADLKPVGIPLYDLLAAALTVPAFESGGIGLYPTSGTIHLDIRPIPTRWGKVGSQTLDFLQTCRSIWPDKPSPDSLPKKRPSPDRPSPLWR